MWLLKYKKKYKHLENQSSKSKQQKNQNGYVRPGCGSVLEINSLGN